MSSILPSFHFSHTYLLHTFTSLESRILILLLFPPPHTFRPFSFPHIPHLTAYHAFLPSFLPLVSQIPLLHLYFSSIHTTSLFSSSSAHTRYSLPSFPHFLSSQPIMHFFSPSFRFLHTYFLHIPFHEHPVSSSSFSSATHLSTFILSLTFISSQFILHSLHPSFLR